MWRTASQFTIPSSFDSPDAGLMQHIGPGDPAHESHDSSGQVSPLLVLHFPLTREHDDRGQHAHVVMQIAAEGVGTGLDECHRVAAAEPLRVRSQEARIERRGAIKCLRVAIGGKVSLS